MKVLHSDRGGEYLGKEFIMHLKAAGTEQKLTVVGNSPSLGRYS